MDEMLNRLTAILALVNDWLKYAEAKNAILLGFSGAGLTVVVTYSSTASNIPNSVKFGCLLATILLNVCSLICSLSFLPKTDLEVIVWKKKHPNRRNKGDIRDDDNLYYFGCLYKYQAHELVDAINRLYLESSIQNARKKEYLDLASQVSVNSEIAYLKFKIFSWALYTLILSLLSIPIVMIISLIFRHSI